MENEMAVAGVVAAPQDFGLAVARDPKVVIAEAKRAADSLKAILDAKPKETWVMMNGERYLEYEDWATVAKFYGVTAKVVSTNPIEINGARGWEARAVAFHGTTQIEVSSADSMCLNDEDKWSTRSKYAWKDGKKEKIGDVSVPSFQLRSMAQTRACAKVLKNVFSWVVVLAGFKPQVAEEMTGDEVQSTKPPIQEPQRKPEPAKASTNGKTEESFVAEFIPASSSTKPDKNGRERFAVKSPDSVWFATYDPAIGKLVCEAREKKQVIKIKFTVDGEYKTIIGVV